MPKIVRRNPLLFLAGLGVCLAAMSFYLAGRNAKAGGLMSEIHVFYTSSVGSNGTLGALFMPEEAMVRTDVSVPPRSTVGLFRASIDNKKYDKVLRQASALSTFNLPPATQFPGTPMVSVGLTEDGQTTLMKSVPAGQIPPEMEAVLETIKTLVNFTLDYPEHAVGANAKWCESSVTPGADVCLPLTFKNVGSENVLLANPAAAGSNSDVGIQLVLVWDGPPKDSNNVTFLDFAPGEVVQTVADKAVNDPTKTLLIPSGEKIDFLLRKTTRILPGSYRARLAITVRDPEGAGKPGLNGAISVELDNLLVSK